MLFTIDDFIFSTNVQLAKKRYLPSGDVNLAKIETRFDQFGFRFGVLDFKFLVLGFLCFESFFAAKVPVMSLENIV